MQLQRWDRQLIKVAAGSLEQLLKVKEVKKIKEAGTAGQRRSRKDRGFCRGKEIRKKIRRPRRSPGSSRPR